jgi:hypothetical protein
MYTRAQVHIHVSKLQILFKRGSQDLMDIFIPEPLEVPGLIENQV